MAEPERRPTPPAAADRAAPGATVDASASGPAGRTLDDFAQDKFYRGTIQRLFQGSQSGVIRSDSGREIPFAFPHLRMAGPVFTYDELREGMRVGFDVGRTSKGVCVSVLRCGS